MSVQSQNSPVDPIALGEKYTYCPMCRTELVVQAVFDRPRQQCPACGWVHFQDPKVGAGVLVEKNGKVLLGRRGINPGRGKWCFPSGFVEIDESPEAAAVRECLEETGLDVELTGLLNVFHYFHKFKGMGILILYRARITGGVMIAQDDMTELAFFGPHELPPDEELAFQSNLEALRRWQKTVGGTIDG